MERGEAWESMPTHLGEKGAGSGVTSGLGLEHLDGGAMSPGEKEREEESGGKKMSSIFEVLSVKS